MSSVLITGCDTGIGREFAIQYAADGHEVHATYRNIMNRIEADGNFRHHQLDVTDFAQFERVAMELAGAPIDILVSNAGVGLETKKLGNLNFDYVETMFRINTLGFLKLAETFHQNVIASSQKRIAIVSSRMGSIAANLTGGHYGYRASKAGLNAIARSLAIDLAPHGVVVVNLHPGWVDTAGGGGGAPVPVADSVRSMRGIIHRLGNHETGQFFSSTGQILPW